MKRISVIVPNLHSPVIGQTLQALHSQEIDEPYEVIVVGQDCHGQVQVDEMVNFITTARPVAPAIARNMGIRSAQGDILAFTDSDCIPNTGWLKQLVGHYRDPDINVVGGGVEFPKDNYWTLCDNLSTFHEYLTSSPAGVREQLPSLNLSLRKSALEISGLFDERYPLPAGEDADLTTRLRLSGQTLHFDPSARVLHLPQRRNLSSLFRHAYHFGRYSVKVDQRYQDHLHPPTVLRSWWMTIGCAPLLAAGVLWKMIQQPGFRQQYWQTLPVIYTTKLAWCFGAAKTLYQGSPFI